MMVYKSLYSIDRNSKHYKGMSESDILKELEKKLAQYESKKSQAKADAKTARTAAKAAKEETKESE